jgi:hypothetical protein
MELSHSSEATSYSATQEFPNISWNPMVHYHVHKSPLLVPILNQINPVHSTPSYFSKIHLILSSRLRLGFAGDLSQSLWLSHERPLCIHLLPICAACPALVLVLDFTILMIYLADKLQQYFNIKTV